MKVYISCPMTTVFNESREKYDNYCMLVNNIEEVLLKNNIQCFNPVFGITHDKFYNYNPKEIRRMDYNELESCDLIIAITDIASFGVGIECAWAEVLNKPLILLNKKGNKISGLLMGLNNVIEIIEYDTEEELINKIERNIIFNESKNNI